MRFFKNDRPSDLDAGYFDNYTVARCPYIFDVVNDPLIIKTLSTFLDVHISLIFYLAGGLSRMTRKLKRLNIIIEILIISIL